MRMRHLKLSVRRGVLESTNLLEALESGAEYGESDRVDEARNGCTVPHSLVQNERVCDCRLVYPGRNRG